MINIDKLKLEVEAAGKGDVSNLYHLIHNNPQFLKTIDEYHFIDTPLHVAARSRNTPLAIEILNLMPSFGKKLNTDGLSPLHVAIDHNMIETAETLVEVNNELVRVKGINGQTPMHHLLTTMNNHTNKEDRNNHLKLLVTFLYKNPECISDVNNNFQMAIHLALEYNYDNNNEAFELLMGWIVRRQRTVVLGSRDDQGNTPLHVAVQKNNLKAVKRLLLMVKRNKKNKLGQTPLDIADQHWNPEMKTLLIRRGAQRASKLAKRESMYEYLSSKPTPLEGVVRSFINTISDISIDTQNVLLVVAALITTATYTAVLQPPGGVYQVSAPDKVPTTVMDDTSPPPTADLRGKTVIGVVNEHPFFMLINTVAFSLSIMMFTFVLHGKTYYILLHACLMCLGVSYLVALDFTSMSPSFTNLMFTIMWALIGSAYAIKWFLYMCAILLAPDVVWVPSFTTVNVQDIFYYGPLSNNKVTETMARLRRQYRMMAVKRD